MPRVHVSFAAAFAALPAALLWAALLVLGGLLPSAAWSQPPPLIEIWESGPGGRTFLHPVGMAVDGDGNLYVTNVAAYENKIQVLTGSGNLKTAWGTYGSADSSITDPMGIATDSHDHVFVAEWHINNPDSQSGFQVFTTSGTYLANWGTYGYGPAPGEFISPFGVAVDSDRRVYVTDTYIDRIQVFTNDGVYVTQWAINGGGVAVDGAANVYVAEEGGGIRKFTNTGSEITSWGSAGTGPGQFNVPYDVTVDGNGLVYVADTYNHRIQAFTADGTYLTEWGSHGTGPGQFDRPMGIAVGADGRIFVADTFNNRIQVFGALSTPARTSSWGRLKALFR